jgi:hypothetical protein
MDYVNNGKNLLVFGSFTVRDWDLVRQRQQTLIDFLVNDFRIFYVERINPNTVGIKIIMKACLKRFLAIRKMRMNRVNDKNLHFIQLKIFPIQKGIFRILNSWLVILQIKKIMKKNQVQYFDSIIISHPANYVTDAFSKVPARKTIYDCFQRFEFNRNFPVEMGHNDKYIAKKVDMVIADSITIYNEKKRLNKNVVRIPQGIDLENYNSNGAKNAGIPNDLLTMGKHRICYTGGFHQSFDFDLVGRLAASIPEATIVLIGKETTEAQEKLINDNIIFLGWKHYTELPLYMKYMDVFIIPYLLNERGKGVFPTKLFEYLYFRKPVISIALPDVIEYSKYLYVAYTKEEFVKLVKDSLFKGANKLDSFNVNFFNQFMNANSWESRYSEFNKYL